MLILNKMVESLIEDLAAQQTLFLVSRRDKPSLAHHPILIHV
jgi:hypothetical protein